MKIEPTSQYEEYISGKNDYRSNIHSKESRISDLFTNNRHYLKSTHINVNKILI